MVLIQLGEQIWNLIRYRCGKTFRERPYDNTVFNLMEIYLCIYHNRIVIEDKNICSNN